MAQSDRAEKNKTTMKKIVDIFNTGDLSGIDSLFSSGYIDHQRPPGLDLDGPEEFKQIVMGARTSLRHLYVTLEDVIAEGDTVAARLQWHGTLPLGKRIDRETIDILRFIAGQVVEHWGAEVWREETEHGGGI